jgi:hypothetical protein
MTHMSQREGNGGSKRRPKLLQLFLLYNEFDNWMSFLSPIVRTDMLIVASQQASTTKGSKVWRGRRQAAQDREGVGSTKELVGLWIRLLAAGTK